MARFKVEILPNSIIKTLTFMGTDFINTWVETNTGSRTLEKAFDAQVECKYPDTPEDLLDLIDEIDCADEDEVQETLEQLFIYEQGAQA